MRNQFGAAAAIVAAGMAGVAFGAPAYTLIWGQTISQGNVVAINQQLEGTGLRGSLSEDDATFSLIADGATLPAEGVLDLDLRSTAPGAADIYIVLPGDDANSRTTILVRTSPDGSFTLEAAQ